VDLAEAAGADLAEAAEAQAAWAQAEAVAGNALA